MSQPADDPVRVHRPRRSTSSRPRYAGSGYGDLKKGVAEAVLDVRRAVPGAGRASYLDDPAELDRRARAAAPTGPARSPPAPWPTVYDRVGFLPGQRPAVSERATIGVAIADPRAVRLRAAGCARVVRRPAGRGRSRPTSRCCRRPTVDADDLDAIEEHLRTIAESRAAVRDPPARHRAPSARCHRWSSSRWRRGIGDCERVEARVRSGPLDADAELPLPPARHRRPRPPRRRARPGLRRAGRLRRALRGRGASASTSTAPTGCGDRSGTTRWVRTCPVRRAPSRRGATAAGRAGGPAVTAVRP